MFKLMFPINVISPNWKAPENVVALVTTRLTGVSEAPYQNCNFAQHVGDSSAAVAENRRRLAQQLDANLDWQWLQQVHGSEASEARGKNQHIAADGLYTKVPGISCCVLIADCLPVLFASRHGNEVAIAHAGWRGMAAGILENTVAKLSTRPADLISWLGPAIGPCHFKVGSEVKDIFLDNIQIGEEKQAIESCFELTENGGEYMADLYAIARHKLKQLGLVHVYGGSHCTFCEVKSFYSYRRDGQTGRMLSMIYFTEDKI